MGNAAKKLTRETIAEFIVTMGIVFVTLLMTTFVPILVPLVFGFVFYGFNALFGTHLGVVGDPFVLLMFLIQNWIDGEITWKENQGSIILAMVKIVLAFGAAAAGAGLYLLVFPAGLGLCFVPQNLTPGTDAGVWFAVALIWTFLYHVVFLTHIFSDDAYGVSLAAGLSHVGFGYPLFFIHASVGNYAYAFAAAIAAGTFGTDWWLPLSAAVFAAGATLALYYVLWRPAFAAAHKMAEKERGNAADMNALRTVKDDPVTAGRQALTTF